MRAASGSGELRQMNRRQSRRGRVLRGVIITAVASFLVVFAYQYFAPSSRFVPNSAPVSLKLSEPGAGQSIVITNTDILATFATALRSGRSHRLTCECAVAGGFEVSFVDGSALPVQYALGHDEGRLHVNIAKHSFLIPFSAAYEGLKKAGIRMPGVPWDYAEDGIPKWPTNSFLP